MNKENNIYKEKIQLGAYYTYDKNNKKVYDLKSIRKSFKRLINKLKQINMGGFRSIPQIYLLEFVSSRVG